MRHIMNLLLLLAFYYMNVLCKNQNKIPTEFKSLLNKDLIEKAHAGTDHGSIIPNSMDLLSETLYKHTGFLNAITYIEPTCTIPLHTTTLPVGTCFTEDNISYKLLLASDDCSGAIIQYYFDDSCSNLVGISNFATNGETCHLENDQSILHIRLKCTTDTSSSSGGSRGSNSATDIIGSFSQLLLEIPESISVPTTEPTASSLHPGQLHQISFAVHQNIQNIALTQYQQHPSAYNHILKAAVAASIKGGITEGNVIINEVSTSKEFSQDTLLRSAKLAILLQSSHACINVIYTIQGVFPYTSQQLLSQLNHAVHTGVFTSLLHSHYLTSEVATGLKDAIAGKVYYVNSGISVVVVVAVVLLLAAYTVLQQIVFVYTEKR